MAIRVGGAATDSANNGHAHPLPQSRRSGTKATSRSRGAAQDGSFVTAAFSSTPGLASSSACCCCGREDCDPRVRSGAEVAWRVSLVPVLVCNQLRARPVQVCICRRGAITTSLLRDARAHRDSGVGKTCLLDRFSNERFTSGTVPVVSPTGRQCPLVATRPASRPRQPRAPAVLLVFASHSGRRGCDEAALPQRHSGAITRMGGDRVRRLQPSTDRRVRGRAGLRASILHGRPGQHAPFAPPRPAHHHAHTARMRTWTRPPP